MIKTKLDLIKDIERFIESNLDHINIDTGQNRVDWKEDATIVYNLDSSLQTTINLLQSTKLKDII